MTRQSNSDPDRVDAASDLLSGVGATAVMMARERALESRRPDALFKDPWAQVMLTALAAQPRAVSAPPWLADERVTLDDLSPGMSGYVPLRTRWFDDEITDAVNACGTKQLVILGAGLDTRAARLTFPSPVTVFALDQAGVLDFVGHMLAGSAPGWHQVVAVPVDLSMQDWPTKLRESGFDVEAVTVWVVEGLLMYLTDKAAAALIEAVGSLSHRGSRLVADLAHPNIHHNGFSTAGQRVLQDNNSPIRSSVADPVDWLETLGWSGDVVDTVALATRYGRPVPAAVDPHRTNGPTFWFTRAHTVTD